jgi:uncharacterized protein with ParB-like and HNH nuclease domain
MIKAISASPGFPMTQVAFGSDTRTVGGLLLSNQPDRIVVPTFQRGYSWQKEHVKEFWDDVTGENTSQYFLGPIVVMRQDGGVIELLDGQQRLATATILFSVLRDIAHAQNTVEAGDFAAYLQRDFIIGENRVRRIQLGELDDSYFHDTIQRREPIERKPTVATHRHIKAARTFLFDMVSAAISGKNSVDALEYLTKIKYILRDDLVLTCITVASDGNAFQIFETLNDRGLRLSIPDLLLNYLMRKALDPDRKLIRKAWDGMVTSMGNKYNISKFIRHLWVSKYGDVKKDMFSVMRSKIESDSIKSLDFVSMCSEECRNYIAIVSYSEDQLGPSAAYVKSLLQSFDANSPLPLLLSAFKVYNQSDFSTIVKWALVFVVRSSGFLRSDSSVLETVFYSLAREIREIPTDDSKAKREKLGEIKERLRRASPSDEQIVATAKKMFLHPDCAEYITRRIADLVESPTKESGSKEESNLEHIYPQSPEENEWGGPSNQQVLEPYVWHIGNLVMLGKRLNTEAGNKEYPLKRAIYRKSGLTVVEELVKDYDHWDKETIEDRAQRLMKRIVQIWSFDNPSRI